MVPLTTAWKDAQDRRNRTFPYNLIINDNTSIMILFNLDVNKKTMQMYCTGNFINGVILP